MRNKQSLAWLVCILLSPLNWAQTHDDAHATSTPNATSTTSAPNGKAATPATEVVAASSSVAIAATHNKILAPDVRILIDVSGSMKQTDPNNLRKPAMDLIVRLLPDKSRAGVWTFGNAVNMLMPHKVVDKNWRTVAAKKSNGINSIAMYTNIGKALDEVSFDKSALNADYKTHIVLLTDGVVDIDKNSVENTKERQRILSEILPSLKSAGYIVHTIALSENSDIALLKKLSEATDGVYTLAESADQLMSVFLKIFDQAVPAERLPLENNGFLVDDSIKEFTALIFRKPGEDKTVIVSPEGKEYSSTTPNDGINWYRTDKYDLITADAPKVGQWKVKTEIAPQSRVTVVSNLQFVVNPLKNNIRSNDALDISYSFQEDGKTLVDKDFHSLIEAKAIIVKVSKEENTSTSFTVFPPPADGFFHQKLSSFNTIGDYEIHIFIDGKTFKREFKHSLSVKDTMMVVEKSNQVADDGKVTYSYKISTDEKLVDIKKTQVSVSIKNSQNSTMEKSLNLVDDNRWEFSFSPTEEGEYSVDIHAQGEFVEGDKLDETLAADKFSYRLKSAEPTSSVVAHEEKQSSVEQHDDEEKNNLWLYIGIGIGHILLLVTGYFVYKFFMGSKAKNELEEFEKTLSTGASKDAVLATKAAQKKSAPDKTEIDLSDEEPACIPMHDEDLDNLFPLDSMEDPTKPNENK